MSGGGGFGGDWLNYDGGLQNCPVSQEAWREEREARRCIASGCSGHAVIAHVRGTRACVRALLNPPTQVK